MDLCNCSKCKVLYMVKCSVDIYLANIVIQNEQKMIKIALFCYIILLHFENQQFFKFKKHAKSWIQEQSNISFKY